MNTTPYEIMSSYASILNKPTIFSNILGFASKGSKIEVVSVSNGWASFYYNGKNAYIRLSSLQLVPPKVTGSVTIKYIDEISLLEISYPTLYTNQSFSSYAYNSKSISVYTVSGYASQTVILTSTNINQTITFKYKKIIGSVTVKYVDESSLLDISNQAVISNLALVSYIYNSIIINGYSISSYSSQTVTLTDATPNQTIVFRYKKLLGKVEIHYVHVSTKKELTLPNYYTNLDLKSYTYIAKDIPGFDSFGETSKTVQLSESSPNQVITFEYRAIRLPLDPSNQNEVPYISTYYIKPVIAPNEEVIIDFYITDYYHNEYINEDYSSNFTVTVKIDGKDDIILPDIKAGDHSVNLGSFTNFGEQKFSILCTDQYGRNSHELFNFFLIKGIVNINEYVMSTNDLAYYKIDNTNNPANVTSTREGLQKLLDDKKSQGYNKLRLLNGIYRIDHLGTIYIPTKFILNMNFATLKLNGFTGAKALMMDINNTFDSHVINGTIEGDYFEHDYTNSPNNSEWVNGVSIGGESKYSSYENIIIKDITGYGSTNGIADSRDGVLGYTYLYPREIGNNFKLGDIDRYNGNPIPSTNRTTCDLQDISGYSEIGYLSVSIYLGYQGNPCGTWNLICHFYDINRNFIKSTDAYQYRRIAVPFNSKFMRVTILNEAYPTNLSIQLFRISTHCSFKNVKHENCRCVGMAQAAMKDMIVENCEFTKCGQTSANCAYDAEDGWDMMQDVTFKTLNFYNNPNNDFLTCAGHNFVVEDMLAGKVHFWERTNSYVVRNCNNLSNSYLVNNSRIKTGYRRFFNNTITGSVNCDSKTDWIIIVKDCRIYKRAEGNSYSTYLRCNIGPEVISPTTDYSYGLASAIYRNCSLKNLNSQHHYAGQFYNCKLENIRGILQGTSTNLVSLFKDSQLSNVDVYAFDKEGFIIQIENCTLNNFTINKNYWDKQLNLTIENSLITNEKHLLRLPHYAIKKPINLINNKFTSIGTLGMINFYDDRTGAAAGELVHQDTITIKNNSIALTNSQYVVTGLTKNTVNNINIVAVNNVYYPATLLLCNPDARQCPNITIQETK